ncbi:hypothetical protein ACP2AV_03505 [Aliiroseovarius sp. PTFE2010]|uniref:hypothetical protein n=1 Tax=Aliiroseovarius sp. PTFE2010 TaxID=3417190 RepID=UPI003CF83CE9
MKRSDDIQEFELTEDMVQSLFVYFDEFAEDGVLRVEKNEIGLWFVSSKRRAFLGLARLPEVKRRWVV